MSFSPVHVGTRVLILRVRMAGGRFAAGRTLAAYAWVMQLNRVYPANKRWLLLFA